MSDFSNIASPGDLSLAALEETARLICLPAYQLRRPQLIVSPRVMHLIETDSVAAEAARIALGEV